MGSWHWIFAAEIITSSHRSLFASSFTSLQYNVNPRQNIKNTIFSTPNCRLERNYRNIKALSNDKNDGEMIKPRKKAKKNSTKGDAHFLRKRTDDIMQVTSSDTDATQIKSHSNFESLSSKGMKVDRRTFNWLIGEWAFSGEYDAPDQAHALLERMEGLSKMADKVNHSFRPDVRIFNHVINAYSRSGRRDAGDKTRNLLNQMERLGESGRHDARPNSQTYAYVMEAYVKSDSLGAVIQAEELYNRMEGLYLEGDKDVIPNTRTFNAMINAWGILARLMLRKKLKIILKR